MLLTLLLMRSKRLLNTSQIGLPSIIFILKRKFIFLKFFNNSIRIFHIESTENEEDEEDIDSAEMKKKDDDFGANDKDEDNS